MTCDILFRMKNNQQYLTLHGEGNVSIMKNSWENLGELLRPKTFVQPTLLQICFSQSNFCTEPPLQTFVAIRAQRGVQNAAKVSVA